MIGFLNDSNLTYSFLHCNNPFKHLVTLHELLQDPLLRHRPELRVRGSSGWHQGQVPSWEETSMCMCICISLYIYIRIEMYICVYIHIHICIYVYIWIYVCISIYIYTRRSLKLERGLLWRVQKAYSSTDPCKKLNTNLTWMRRSLHAYHNNPPFQLLRARSTNGDYISTSGIVIKINGRPNIDVSFASMKNWVACGILIPTIDISCLSRVLLRVAPCSS